MTGASRCVTSDHSSVVTPPKPSVTSQPTGGSRRTVTRISATTSVTVASTRIAGLGARAARVERGGQCCRVADADSHGTGLALVCQAECLQRDRVADVLGRSDDLVVRWRLGRSGPTRQGRETLLGSRLVDESGGSGRDDRRVSPRPPERSPTVAAASSAASASDSPSREVRPRLAMWARNGSLMHSASVATTTARPPVASAASASASAARYQAVGSLSVGGRSVEQQHRRVLRPVHHGAERARHCRPVAPHERVVVERIADRDEFGERVLDATGVLGSERLERQLGGLAAVGDQRSLAARAAERHDLAACAASRRCRAASASRAARQGVRTVATP